MIVMIIKEIPRAIIAIMVVLLVGNSFKRATADFAPEKMNFDNEERQAMILEPRSFIPHPGKARAIHPSTTTSQTRVISTYKDESNEELENSGVGRNEDEGEIVKDDEGSTTASGDDSVSLGSHGTNPKKLEAPYLASLNTEPTNSFSSPSAVQSSTKNEESLTSKNNQPIPFIVTPQVNYSGNLLPQKDTKNNGENRKLDQENKSDNRDRLVKEKELKDEKDGRNNAHQESTAANKVDSKDVSTMDEENDTKYGESNHSKNIGDASIFGLKNDKPQIKIESIPKEQEEDIDDDDENESGSGFEEEKTSSLDNKKELKQVDKIHQDEGKATNQKNEVRDENKSTESEQSENDKHSDEIDNKNKGNDIDNDDDNDEDNDEDNVDNRDDDHDHDTTFGSSKLPVEEMKSYSHESYQNKPTEVSPPKTNREPLNTNTNVKMEKDESEDEDEDYKEDEDKIEDAIDIEKDDEDDEEDDESEDDKEGKTSGPSMNVVESSTPQQQTNHQTFKQNTIHKTGNVSKNTENIQISPKTKQASQQQTPQSSAIHKQTQNSLKQQASQSNIIHKLPTPQNFSQQQTPPSNTIDKQTSQQRIPKLDTVYTAESVKKVLNRTQNSRKIHKQQNPQQSLVKHLHVHKTLVRTEKGKPIQKAKPTTQTDGHTAVIPKQNPKQNSAEHSEKNQEKPKKSKSLLKYIHRPNLHNHLRGEATINKTAPHECNSDNVKTGYSLKGGTRAGHVEDLGGSVTMHECIGRCCHKKVCDVALMLDGRCFGVACYSKELCKPIMVPHPHYVNSKIAFLDRAQRRDEVERARPDFDCKYGELTIRNNHRWSGELCAGVVSCKNGIVTVEKCPDVPPKPTNCANPKLFVKQRPGKCCIKKWKCKDKSCKFGGRTISHGVSLSDQLCTGVVKCMNGHLETTTCPGIPEKPTNCANPRLKIKTKPGKCCKKRWVCEDKSCTYDKLKVDDGERLTDASCAVVMECKNGFLNFKHCPSPPPIPAACLNPSLKVKRILGECCHMKWQCAQEIK